MERMSQDTIILSYFLVLYNSSQKLSKHYITIQICSLWNVLLKAMSKNISGKRKIWKPFYYMINYNENEVPQLRGETDGRSAVVLNEADLAKVTMNAAVTNLPKDAIVEFLNKLIVKAQKRRKTDPDDAPKNNFILMSVNGKQRWIGSGTFTRRRFDVDGNPFISPEVANDIPEDISLKDFYEKFKEKKYLVKDRIQVQTNVFDDAGNRTEKTTTTTYPVLVYAN